jgi:uncharacterized protein (DUF433 family)
MPERDGRSSQSNTMPDHPRITLDPAVPVIRGTRIAVEFVIELMAEGWSKADTLANYPHLQREDIFACLAYARDLVSSERVYPITA